jgi:hypothetical protein
LANWIKKEDPTISSLQGTHLIDRKNTALGWKDGRIYTKAMAPQNRQE